MVKVNFGWWVVMTHQHFAGQKNRVLEKLFFRRSEVAGFMGR